MRLSTSLLGAILLCLAPRALPAGDVAPAKPGPGNPFFAMDTATKDARHQTLESQAQMLKELGYAGYGPSLSDNIPEMLKALDAHGVKLSAVYLGANLDPDQPKYDPRLKQAIRLLQGRDTYIWLFIQSKKYKPSDEAGDGRAVEIIREIADMAEPAGLRVALYPHTGFWLERVEDAVRLAKKVDRKNVGATFNLCHWLKVDDERNMRARLKEAMPHLFLVSINGADRGETNQMNWDRLIQTLDRGSFDVYRLLKTLDELGYTGPIGFQGYGIKGDARENLERTMRAWRKLSARLAAEKNRPRPMPR